MKTRLVDTIEKFNKGINRYSIFTFCVVTILILIGLYLILDEKAFIRLTYLIVPIVALASLYVVYLSIEVMKMSNRFASGLLRFKALKRKIKEFEEERNVSLFSARWSHDFQRILGCDVRACTYLHFIHPLNKALEQVMESERYKQYLSWASSAKPLNDNEIHDILEFTNCLNELKRRVYCLCSTFKRISTFYGSICFSS